MQDNGFLLADVEVRVQPVNWLTGLSFFMADDALLIPDLGTPELNQGMAKLALAMIAGTTGVDS